ncbi:carbon-sulfur lyase [Ascochyta rabiei]|uniref:Carbon-sulfur lyase n=2 Tax=Didymella rabiei TaxID=5454 RepID=A0A163ER85_DIDRA|nr:carbon-sulfur lyase [Ascochyta rabiei]
MASSTPITHIVLFKYRPDITWTDFQTHFDAFRALQSRCLHPDTGKPYMLSMRMGQNNSWEPFSKGMTHAFVLEFASQAHLDYYLLHDGVHAEFSRAAKPLIEDSVVVDITDGVLFGPRPKKPVGLGGLWTGACHCGDVEWEVAIPEEEELRHIVCHCDTCKKLGGGPYSCNYIVPREALSIRKGRTGEYAYKGASGKDVHCYFCPRCTSHVYHHQDAMPEKVIVRTLLLDGGNELQAGGEIFAEGALGWAQDLKRALTQPTPSKSNAKSNGANGVNGV